VLASLTLLVAAFAHEVSRAGHATPAVVASENRTFASLATSLIDQVNSYETSAAYLLEHGGGLPRVKFWSRLVGLRAEGASVTDAVAVLSTPTIAQGLNGRLQEIATKRIAAITSVVGSVAQRLTLPWPATLADAQPFTTLTTTSTAWHDARRSWHGQPGAVPLPDFGGGLAVMTPGALDALVSSPSLALHRAVGLTAVAVRPAPLPATTGILLLAPASHVHLGFTVTNFAVVRQDVTVRVSLTPSRAGPTATTWTRTATLSPLASMAFTPPHLPTTPGERARLVITVSGAPAQPGQVLSRVYHVILTSRGA